MMVIKVIWRGSWVDKTLQSGGYWLDWKREEMKYGGKKIQEMMAPTKARMETAMEIQRIKLEEIMVGTQPAIGDIKRLLANLLGVPTMEEILQKAGLNRYVGNAVNDPELFSANGGRVWRVLRDTFLTNVHTDNILIEPLGQEENPGAYVLRAHQVWRNITGNDPDFNQMEESILQAKIQKGLPLPVRSKLAEVVGLGSMAKVVYTDHIAHQVELYRKKEHDQEEQYQEDLRKLNQIQLVDNKKKKKNQALVIQSQSLLNQPLPQLQPNQVQPQLSQPSSVIPVDSVNRV
ncbi:hypothetical protein AOLI_G00045030 [Acnodon oligacanthus]